MYWFITVLAGLTLCGLGALAWVAWPGIKERLFDWQARRRARRLFKKEAEDDLCELKKRLKCDAENFIRESEAPLVRVPKTDPPKPPTVTELILQDVDSDEITRMLIDGRARRD